MSHSIAMTNSMQGKQCNCSMHLLVNHYYTFHTTSFHFKIKCKHNKIKYAFK